MTLLERIKLWFQRHRGWPLSLIRRRSSYSAGEQRELIKSLERHPGFVLLIERLEMLKAYYEHERKNIRPDDEASELFVRNIIKLDEPIFWIGWLQDEVKAAGVEIPLPPPEPEQY